MPLNKYDIIPPIFIQGYLNDKLNARDKPYSQCNTESSNTINTSDTI